MPIKYHFVEPPATVIVNDLFLASFLHCTGCKLTRVEKNARQRVSFVFTGERVATLRDAYRTGPVHLDIRDFRASLNLLRDLLAQTAATPTPEERSVYHARPQRLAPHPQY
jgi:hypothetical protein